jgi:hypothetical protein
MRPEHETRVVGTANTEILHHSEDVKSGRARSILSEVREKR